MIIRPLFDFGVSIAFPSQKNLTVYLPSSLLHPEYCSMNLRPRHFQANPKFDCALRREYNEPPLVGVQDLACSWSVSVRTAESCLEFHLPQSRQEAVVALRMVRLLWMSCTISWAVASYCHRITFPSTVAGFRFDPEVLLFESNATCHQKVPDWTVLRTPRRLTNNLVTSFAFTNVLKSRFGHTGH